MDYDSGTLALARLAVGIEGLRARGVTLIAGRVQTRGEYEWCRSLGFDAFQGDYVARPRPMTGRRTPTQGIMALAGVLSATGADAFEELERAICRDAGLAHRFLRLADCALYGGRERVRSVRDALARLGAHAARQWALMMVVAGMTDTRLQAARHLLAVGLHRARLCELLAREEAHGDPERAFSAGLLSILPALTNWPPEELLGELPLDEALADALLDHLGSEGRVLAAAVAYESGERENAYGHPRLLGAISRIYAESLLWAEENTSRLS